MARSRKAATVDLRAELEKLMRATLADESAFATWTYRAVRPCGMPTPTRRWKVRTKVSGDCSKGVQFLCWWTPGAPDPMHSPKVADWGPYGNSQTLWSRLQHLDDAGDLLFRPAARLLKVGDIVTFGPDGDDHAAMVLESAAKANGWDPLVWSFGHQGAPNAYRLSQDSRPQQYLRNPIPTYVPTSPEQARARTGWFAWVAWRLGEGDYEPYGKADPAARPNVPKLIPASWWRRYAKFLLRRKKPTSASVPIAA